MSIAFDKHRWERTRENYGLWWEGQLKRPLIHVTLYGRDPGRPEPSLPYYGFTSFYDFAVTPEAIVDRWDHNLGTLEFLGDGFPGIWPNFGPGVMAAFLGANVTNGIDTTWFHPRELRDIQDLRFEYTPDNPWLERIKAICRAALERWEGQVQIGMTDLGGNLDILSTFRPNERLLLDLFDHPQEVKRLTWEAHYLWWRYFNEINAVLRPVNPGYMGWLAVFSDKPTYPLQCDFAYMLGPDMFNEFVKPELAESCRKLSHALYHLDGVGQLPHLDSLLGIKELKAIQWVPGEGKPGHKEWPEVYRKIRDAGKLIQVWGSLDVLDTLAAQLGSAEGIIMHVWLDIARKREAEEFLEKYGVTA
jgi:hypothetical protein